MSWLSRLFTSKRCPVCEVQEQRIAEYRAMLGEERMDRRKTEDAWRQNVAQAMPVFEKAEPEPVTSSVGDDVRRLAQEIESKAQWAALSEDGWAIAEDMAQRDVNWLAVYRRAKAIRQEYARTAIDDSQNEEGLPS